MSPLTFLFGILYIPLIYSGSMERKNDRQTFRTMRQLSGLGPLLGNVNGQLVNLPGLIPGPPGAPVVNLGGLSPQPNGGPLLNLAPLPVILPGVIAICVDQAGQPLLGPFTPGCSTLAPGNTLAPGATLAPGVSQPGGGPNSPGIPGSPGSGGPGGTGDPLTDLTNQIIKLIQSLLNGNGGPATPAQPPLLGFTPIPPSQLIPGIAGLPSSITPGTGGPPSIPGIPQNPFFGNFPFPFPPSSVGFGIPGGLQFGSGVPGFINVGVPGLPGGPGVPSIPSIPSIPGIPNVPGIPVGPGIIGGSLGPCGRKGTSRILNGGSATTNEYCWHATIFSRGLYKCSATIIGSLYVITTAFCVIGRNPGELNVRVGESVISSTVGFGGQFLGIETITVHPDYNPTSGRYENNIAVIKLSKPIEASQTVCSICLPSQVSSMTDGSQFNNQRCTVTGFGSNTVPGGKNSEQLKAITLPVIPYSTCSRVLMKSVLNFQPHPSFLCAGGVAGQDACTGDGGGALACLGSDGVTYTVAGIASWGAGCGKGGIPAVYTNIAALMDFISANSVQ